jgi:hypothetical protein
MQPIPVLDLRRMHEAHAPDHINDEAVVLWRNERRALNRANARTDRCAQFYDTQKTALEATP